MDFLLIVGGLQKKSMLEVSVLSPSASGQRADDYLVVAFFGAMSDSDR